ncbi:MAG: AAA family ATPase [Zoogloeaceae bacterium]|jgi:exonuclease SbcC|nr:AAA family ATPase [Zoogloeaceae bacterium]
MRILNIRFQNLNSLVGEWVIDLTHPAYLSDGIFAITGPTGAGKSTILDAICLALYGRTPRLSKISKGVNEIISRQTGECFAEVTFETGAGRYRCHWSQRRARGKPDGELQAPQHEISDAASGKVMATKIREVAEQIEAATGMDFERFTRSMLLAQGGFAAFLEASPDGRAPILEQITGTEIYSQISIRTHERRSDERKKLDALRDKLAGIPLLAPEVEQQSANELTRKTELDNTRLQQISHKNQAIAWLEGIFRLETELQSLIREKRTLQTQMETFAPERARLDAAQRALELAADYTRLSEARKAQASDQLALREHRESLPRHTEAARQGERDLQAATRQLEANKAEQQQTLPILRKARELDTKIAAQEAPIKTASAAIAEQEISLKALTARQDNDIKALEAQRKTGAALRQQLQATQADGALVEGLSGLAGRFAALQTLHRQLAEKQDEIIAADKTLRQATAQVAEKRAATAKESQRAALQASLAEKQAAWTTLLENRTLADWRNRQIALVTRDHTLARMREAVRARAQAEQALRELSLRQTALAAEAVALTHALAKDVERQGALAKERDLLETQLNLLQKIEDLQTARHQLRDGEACPLCGALEHPFARGNIPSPNATRQSLEALKREIKSVEAAIAQTGIKQAQADKEREQATLRQKEHAESIAAADRLLGGLLTETGVELNAADAALTEKLATLQADNARQLAQSARTLEAAEVAEAALNVLHAALEQARAAEIQAEREIQAAVHQCERAAERLERLKQEAAAYQAQARQDLQQAIAAVQPFDIATLTADKLQAVLEQLTIRRDQWLTRQKENTALEQKITALEQQTRYQAEQMQNAERKLGQQREQQAGLLRERENLLAERQKIFGDKKTDSEEARLAAAIETAEKMREAARQKQSAVTQTLQQWNTRIDTLEKAIKARDAQLHELNADFLTRLRLAGFAGEADHQAASLPENERKHLATTAQKLAEKSAEIAAKEVEKTGLLATEREKRLTAQSVEELKTERDALADEQKQLQQDIGALRKSLRDNENLKQQYAVQAEAITAQQRECARWEALHELIGSSDGKKYRNFAQGLTFEIMIGHANRQLRKMTERYLLTRDDDNPLELGVIDNYQAGEIRSTRNLSGGESFIISLSLALGLSHMASRNVRVDSLFLDEGFGALDEEALDTALETLAGLPQDGKLIGIISHVPAIRERIGVQIHVTPQTGGRSRIDGPGCGNGPTLAAPLT